MIFCIIIFIFWLEPPVREQLDENNFRRYYSIFFESNLLKLLNHSYVESSFTAITRNLGNDIQRSPYIDINQHGNNSFLSKYL